VWIDGRAFSRPDKLLWKGGRKRTIKAQLDRYEDPHDVYRVRLGARSAARFQVRPSYGDADIEVLHPDATSFTDEGIVVARSGRGGRRTDSVTVRNRGRRARTAYVHVYVDRRASSLDAGYGLTVRRVAF
jgi:hypothetical protein